jgi:hypothetical protein
MTRAKHIALVRSALNKGIPAEWSVDQLAEGIVNRMELALEMEAEEADSGLVDLADLKPRPDLDKPQEPARLSDSLPAPQPDNRPGSSLIIPPDGPEAKEVFQNKPELAKPIPLRPAGPLVSGNGPRRHWQQGQLRDYVASATENTIQVMAKGRPGPVTLVRNLEVLPGVDLVKLSYSLGETVTPSPSSQNLGGEAIQAMAIDAPIFTTFSCFDRDQDIAGKMQSIFTQAEIAYSPKPETIHSSTPRRSGALSYRLEDPHHPGGGDPHDEVGGLPNPITGKVW